MSAQFDEVLFKQRTREMVAFLKEKGVDVPLTLGYEAVARHLFGAKSWNNLSSDLKKGLISPSITASVSAGFSALEPAEPSAHPRLKCRVLDNGGERVADMVVRATFYSSDGQALARFPVTHAFRVLRDESILQLAVSKWNERNFMKPMAEFRRADNEEVRAVLEHVENRPGIELLGGVDRRDAIRYVRAFRPHLLAKVLLLEKFGTLPKAAKAGFKVSEGKQSKAGQWSAKSAGEKLYPEEGGSDYFETQAQAWEAVAWDLLELQGTFEVKDLFHVLHGSGFQES